MGIGKFMDLIMGVEEHFRTHIGHRTVKLGLIPDTDSHLEPSDRNRKISWTF